MYQRGRKERDCVLEKFHSVKAPETWKTQGTDYSVSSVQDWCPVSTFSQQS